MVITSPSLNEAIVHVLYCGTPLWRRPRYNEKHLKARQNYSKICGNEPRYSE